MPDLTDAELDRLVEHPLVWRARDVFEDSYELADHLRQIDSYWTKEDAEHIIGQHRDMQLMADEITALRARIAEDQAQIAALTTYRENLRDEVIELRARIAELEAFQQQAIKQVCELAREAGEAKGKLEASEMPGIVDGWREKCERLERRVAELEADRAEWVGEREESIRRGARRTPGRFRL